MTDKSEQLSDEVRSELSENCDFSMEEANKYANQLELKTTDTPEPNKTSFFSNQINHIHSLSNLFKNTYNRYCYALNDFLPKNPTTNTIKSVNIDKNNIVIQSNNNTYFLSKNQTPISNLLEYNNCNNISQLRNNNVQINNDELCIPKNVSEYYSIRYRIYQKLNYYKTTLRNGLPKRVDSAVLGLISLLTIGFTGWLYIHLPIMYSLPIFILILPLVLPHIIFMINYVGSGLISMLESLSKINEYKIEPENYDRNN